MFQRTSIFGIKASNDFEVSVECAFNDSLTTTTDANISTSKVVAEGSQGHGNFAFDVLFYTDEKYPTKSPETDIIIPGENVFFGIKSSIAIELKSLYHEIKRFLYHYCFLKQIMIPFYDTVS